jgi:hypothetical protein
VRMGRAVRLRAAMALIGGLALSVPLTTACQRADTPPVVLPAGVGHVVASSGQVDGFVPPAWHAFEVARVAVYSDGSAVADARYRLMLTPAEVRDLVAALRHDLAGLGPTVPGPGGEQVSDAATTVLRLLDTDGSVRSVSAYALDILRGYPKGLITAHDRLERLAERVVREGGPYSADRVRVVAEERTDGAANGTWPDAVPVPPANDVGVRVADLSGDQADAIVAALPGIDPTDTWPVLRTSDGLNLAVIWRFLLPDE